MGKTSKWIKRFLIGKKDKDKEKNNTIATNVQVDDTLALNALPRTTVTVSSTPPAKEKRRWSFRRSSSTTTPPNKQPQESETEHKIHVMEMAPTLDETVVEAKAADDVMESTNSASDTLDAIKESSAIKIQSFYRGCLARKALNALRGLVKLQALVRGHLVRKQAAATLRCMQALIKVQSRARAQRLHMVEESKSYNSQKPFNHRKLSYDFLSQSFQDLEVAMEESVKIVEMDSGDSKPNMRRRNTHSSQGNGNLLPFEHIISTPKSITKLNQLISLSPSPSSRTDQTPRTSSNHFEDYSFNTAQSSPQNASQTKTNHAESIYREYPQFYPSYMANTQSSKAKVRSHSAPKSRPETYERQSSVRRKGSIEGRNVPRGVKMLRSSSHVGAAQNHQYPWSTNLNKSAFSLNSECGSNSTVLSNAKYCRSVGWI